MDLETLDDLLEAYSSGQISREDAAGILANLPYSDLGFAKVDHHRGVRQGLAEAVYCPGKTPGQCSQIVADMLARPGSLPVIMTRASVSQATLATKESPGGQVWPSRFHPGYQLDEMDLDFAREERGLPEDEQTSTVTWRHRAGIDIRVSVVTAGTSDLPVASEAYACLSAYGFGVDLFPDCGVAGIHRLFDQLELISGGDIVVVVAGMEGALASVVGGLVACPIVAVPSSSGYGSSFQGITAMLSMLSSCAAGITVVGIDNGFGAALACVRMGSKASGRGRIGERS